MNEEDITHANTQIRVAYDTTRGKGTSMRPRVLRASEHILVRHTEQIITHFAKELLEEIR